MAGGHTFPAPIDEVVGHPFPKRERGPLGLVVGLAGGRVGGESLKAPVRCLSSSNRCMRSEGRRSVGLLSAGVPERWQPPFRTTGEPEEGEYCGRGTGGRLVLDGREALWVARAQQIPNVPLGLLCCCTQSRAWRQSRSKRTAVAGPETVENYGCAEPPARRYMAS